MKPKFIESKLIFIGFILDARLKKTLQSKSLILQEKYQKFILAFIDQKEYTLSSIQNFLSSYSFTTIEFEAIIHFLESSIYKSISFHADFILKLHNHYNTKAMIRPKVQQLLESCITSENIKKPDLLLYLDQYKTWDSIHREQNNISSSFYSSIYLIEYYILNAIINLCVYLTNSQLKNKKNELVIDELEKLEQLIQLYQLKSTEVDIFIQSSRLILYNKKNDFEEIYSTIEKFDLNLIPRNISSIYLILINSLYHNLSLWGYEQSKLLDIYISMKNKLGKEFYNELKPQTIKNIATLSIRSQNKTVFYQLFNDKNTPELSLENQDALKLCEAKFVFYDQDYHACIEILNLYKTHDLFQELELRRLQVMCFYELRERVLVDNYLNTFKVFIHRNDTVNKIYKESNNNFIRILNRLNRTIDLKKLDGIQTDFLVMNQIAEKQWLKEKVKELYQKLALDDEKESAPIVI